MTFRMKSLQSRIILFHVFAIILATVAVPVANYIVINRSTDLFEARILRAHATDIARYLGRDGRGSWYLALPSDLDTLYSHGLEGLSYAVKDDNGRRLLSSGPRSDALLIPRRNGLAEISHDNVELYGLTVNDARSGLWITVAQNVQHPDVIFDDIVSYYLSRIGWFTVAILALLLVIDIVIIRGGLAPVVQASNIASAIDPKRTDIRLPASEMPRELLPLIQAINEALDRLEVGIKLQKEFTADAAHELRTPLAVLRARIESLPDQRAMSDLKDDIDIMTHVVTQLLEMAELEDATIKLDERVDLRAISADVVGLVADVAIAQDKEVALTGQSGCVWVRGNGGMIYRAVRNLVDNAIKYTASGTEITVDVDVDGTVQVLDRGPGVPASQREMMFQRFWRGRLEGSGGAGLGLAIVSRIAELHGAKIQVLDRPGGGTIFAIGFTPIS